MIAFDKTKQTVEVFAICYNEGFIMKAFVEHYKNWYNANITILDNESTDNSVKIAKEMGCKVLTYKTGGKLSDAAYLDIKNRVWRNSKADWVIVCDMDEFLEVNFDISRYTIINSKGYDVVGGLDSRMGVYNDKFCKHLMFKPNHITEINYTAGCHSCNPKGFIQGSIELGKIMHRKYISPEYVYRKHLEYEKRMSELNKKFGWGKEYIGTTICSVTKKFDELKQKLELIP